MNQYDENVRELPSEQKNRDSYETEHQILVAKLNLTHSLQLSFPHWVKVILSGIGRAMARYKVNCFHLLVACSQSSFTSVWTSLATQELQISFQCWWTRFGNGIDIWWDVRGIHIQLKPIKLKAPKVQLIGMWRFLFVWLKVHVI